MENLREQIREAVKRIFDVEIEAEVTAVPAAVAEETGADYASNVAMKLAKVAHRAPMEIAQEIAQEMTEAGFKAEVAAPGFLNFISPDEYYDEKVAEMAENAGNLTKNITWNEYAGKTVIAEFSDPNPFKVLHVGHLYTSVVGDSISRLLEVAGAKVKRLNFGGDVGLHVAKTMYALLRIDDSQTASAKNRPSALDINRIAECYVEGTRAYEEDETAKAEIAELNRMIYALAEAGENGGRLAIEAIAEEFGRSTAEVARVAELYWAGRRLSYEYFEEFYARIGVKFDKFYPESTVAGRGLAEVKAHVGTVYEESDGAIVYKGEKRGLHTRVFINKQGVPTYEAKDVGLIFTKWDDWKFDESVVITGNEQAEYMKVVLASVKEYAPELVERTRHFTHGLVKLVGGVKMSSRKGNFLKAVDVLEMVNKELAKKFDVETTVNVSRPASTTPAVAGSSRLTSAEPADDLETSTVASAEEPQLAHADQVITLAALKYSFLKYKMGGDIVFDPKESVAVNGNSGVYLLYSAVRAKKILLSLRGAALKPAAAPSQDAKSSSVRCSASPCAASKLTSILGNKFVRKLGKKLTGYEDALKVAVREKAPYKLCAYLYELAQEFSRFYEHVRVVGGGHETELAKYVRAYAAVMEEGLGLLGIEIPEEM